MLAKYVSVNTDTSNNNINVKFPSKYRVVESSKTEYHLWSISAIYFRLVEFLFCLVLIFTHASWSFMILFHDIIISKWPSLEYLDRKWLFLVVKYFNFTKYLWIFNFLVSIYPVYKNATPFNKMLHEFS